jgi:hypothetical protein
VKLTPVETFTNTAILEAPVLPIAATAVNDISSKCVPFARLSRSSAYPAALGATAATVPETYVHAGAPASDPGHANPP